MVTAHNMWIVYLDPEYVKRVLQYCELERVAKFSLEEGILECGEREMEIGVGTSSLCEVDCVAVEDIGGSDAGVMRRVAGT